MHPVHTGGRLIVLAAFAACAVPPALSQTAPAARPRASASAPADCTARWAAYQRSQSCYARYQNANGSLKPGAESACGKPLLDPSPQCGPAAPAPASAN